mmetsp:Transcript_9841/g.23175  ORF Transcript_9841/g.23175 Transcript_9841/m.23175 type:complete len:110 (-) Transcript_9841:847-1176(-)
MPRKDHAIIMAKFSTECRSIMNKTVRKLEVLLGPDTADLQMRFGLHSGPVTAGVLRGEKCRFQLFGDTVNTYYRQNTERRAYSPTQSLMAAGLSDWVRPRATPLFIVVC